MQDQLLAHLIKYREDKEADPMTEQEWLECTEPGQMIKSLGLGTKQRKLRLFAVACCRAIIHLADDRCREALAVAEQFADGLATAKELKTAWRVAHEVFCEFQGVPEDVGNAVSLTCSHEDLEGNVIEVASTAQALAVVGIERSLMKASRILARRRQSRWLRDIFGNPFRPVSIDLSWLTPNVLALVQTTYVERELPSGNLDATRLSVLADALEDDGCTNGDILNHCRQPLPHVRGCWVIDALLANE
jgi:hypothetical protein